MFEAFDGYWRKTPSVKRLVFKSVPDPATRLAMLKRGEVDLAFAVNGELGEEVRRTPGLTLKPTLFMSIHWLVFADQWDPSSPWHDRRVRLAATHAVDRQAVNQAVTLGFSRINGSIIPPSFDFYWQPPLYPHDRARAQAAPRRGRPPERLRRRRLLDATPPRRRTPSRSSTTSSPSASRRGCARSSARGS